MYTFGFIGCGNMGGALALAVSASGVKGDKLLLSDASESKVAALAKEINGAVSHNKEIAEKCDYIFLGVKPNLAENVLREIKSNLNEQTVIVSMAAGLTIDAIKKAAGNIPVIRIMPNTPVKGGKGTILYATDGVTEEMKTAFLDSLKDSAELLEIPEKLIDAGSAVSGCGPAFGYMFIEALADGGVKCGLSRADAIKLAASTLRGAAEMVLKTGEHPEKLKDDVCSPGGSTIAGVHALENGGFRSNVINCVEAAYKRTKELV